MRNYIIIPVIVGLMLLTGCGTSTNSNTQLSDPYVGGNVAFNLYLQNGMPPPTVYDGGKFPFGINVVLENVGESDVGPGTENPYMTARVEGILPANFGITDADLTQTLQEKVTGAKKNFDGTIMGGQPANFIFQGFNYQGKLQGNQLVTLRSTVCYDYSNTASVQYCMKSDILENVQDSTLCTLTGDKVAYNSGGPIHVTKVIQNPLAANKIQLTFRIEHVGVNGEFYGRSGNENCNPSVRNTNKYNIGITVSTQDAASKITCYRLQNSRSGNITLYNGAPQDITCTVEHPGGTTARVYTDTLYVKTTYRYGQFIEQPVIIQSVPTS